MPGRYPVCIRGVVYPSAAAAGRAFGLSARSIHRALEGGWIDEVGIIKRKGGARPKPCTYRGKRYPSITAAAEACGVTKSAVSRAVLYARNNPMAERRAA